MTNIRRSAAAVLSVFILLIWEPSMAFGKQLVLASEFHGRLVTSGETPAANVRISRKLNWGWTEEIITDETTTGEDGRFTFPKVTRRSLMAGVLPHQPSIAQEIMAHGPKGEVNIWFADKSNYRDNGELDRPINVICHLDREPSADGLFWGTCVEAN